MCKQAGQRPQFIIGASIGFLCGQLLANALHTGLQISATVKSKRNACVHTKSGCSSANQTQKPERFIEEQVRKGAYLVQLVEDRLQLLRRIERLQPVHLGDRTTQGNDGCKI